jgi:hypothetical protein
VQRRDPWRLLRLLDIDDLSPGNSAAFRKPLDRQFGFLPCASNRQPSSASLSGLRSSLLANGLAEAGMNRTRGEDLGLSWHC